MKLPTFKNIKTKLIFWFSIISILPLATVLIVVFDLQKNLIETQTIDKLVAIRDLKLKRLRNWLHERVGDMNTMASDKELTDIELLTSNSENTEKIDKTLSHSRQIISRYIKNYDSYNSISILDPKSGEVILSTNKLIEGDNRSSEKYFKTTIETRSIFFTDIYYSNHDWKNVWICSIPIFCTKHSDEHIMGILVAEINLENTLYPLLSDNVGLGETGETLIVNKDGYALNELRYYKNAPLKLKITAEPAQLASKGHTGIINVEDYRDVKVMAAYAHIPETNWGFVCKQDVNELNKPMIDSIFNFIIIFIITVVFIYLIALGIGKTISQPIEKMDKVAQNMRKGDFSERIELKSKDELSSLATEFNHMAEELASKLRIQTGNRLVSDAIVGKTNLKGFCYELLKKLMKVTNSSMSTFYILNETSFEYEIFTSIGANEQLLKPFSQKNPEGEIGLVVTTRNILYLKELPDDTSFIYRTTAGDIMPKEIIAIPISIDNTVIGIISLVNIDRFSSDAYDILVQSWQNINASFSSLLSNERTRILAEQLTRINKKLEQQTEELQAQSEELQAQSEELQAQNIELDRQRKQVEESSRLKGEFLSNMSHELRTPLNSIMALSRALILQTKERLTDEELNYLEIVERNGEQLLEFINDILDLSKIEAGKMNVNIKEISPIFLLENVCESLKPIAKEKNLELKYHLDTESPNLMTDETKLHQVLLNIIGNSVKFTEQGEVEINTKFDSENFVIQVSDTGIGISEESLPHIFEEFRQVDGSTTKQFEGTGLGLAIANKLVKILKGNINVKSKINEGSTFTIVLPIEYFENSD